MTSTKLIDITVCFFLCMIASDAPGQGTFQNLDFESANVTASGPEPYGTFVPIGAALPSWLGYLGAGQQTQVGYNSPTAGTATISLLGPTWNSADTSLYGVGIIDGNYSVLLQSGSVPGNNLVGENASIVQSGTIPSTAESIQFRALGVGPFTVSFGGNTLSTTTLTSGQSADGLPYTTYGVDISAWEGQSGDLEFTADYNVNDPYLVLDDITFSPQAVPEPSPLVLTSIGAVLFALCRRFAPKS